MQTDAVAVSTPLADALEAHVVVAQRDMQELERIKAAVKRLLKDEFGVAHPTLELELPATAGEAGHDTPVIAEH